MYTLRRRFILLHYKTSLSLIQFKIIGDHKRKSGIFEYGTRYYTAGTRNKSAFRESEQWWFVHQNDIKCKLNPPRVDKISTNKTFYFFDDI